ncbi:acetyl-CoA carboxylase carboxyltransferase subunit beta [Lactiplantibacillus modestisalitolerans]|uniref:Acetyl-coenzyme A carboxylase carboxyl transferase subunit beta n=1 Tax=Lactiplantibacillus modestisalitolerans TaxID=1457219 RepID=A0ABV5WQ78_9LACO|nr:acetyl-CoA carboxylase carboxyltransferase subunit beta [Lactiplantibacillus modestisalitolerans]
MSHYPKSGTWQTCRACGRHVHQSQWGQWRQCPYCQHWQRLTARQRLTQLVDPASFQPLPMPEQAHDALAFPGYQEKLTTASHQSGADEAIIIGTAKIAKRPCVLAVMDSHFMMGTLNTVVSRRLQRACAVAQRRRLPLIVVTASGGARMQEGLYALFGMNLILAAVARLAAAAVPLITVLTDPTMGGVSASFAFKGDVIVAEAGAKIGFAGPRVIQQTMPAQLPADFQSAEQLWRHGMVDAVVARPDLRAYLQTVLASYAMGGNADAID